VTSSQTARTCPQCGETEARLFLQTSKESASGTPYQILTCSDCGQRYTSPLPSPEDLADLYSQDYYVANNPRLLSGDLPRILLQRIVLGQREKALLGRPPGRILDIGCGNGDFLAHLAHLGWEIYGTEFSTAACGLAEGRGVRVHHGDLTSARFPSNFFDVVTLWHVLEHLPEPREELEEIKRVLRADGLVVVEVPNSASPTLRMCGEQWYPLDVPLHLQHFTPRTLVRLLQTEGFAQLRRKNFHYWDFTYVFYSYMSRLGILQRLGISYFSTDYKQAPLAAKAIFLALGVPVALMSLPYSVLATALSGHSETITITARRGAAAATSFQ
jgi:ubiquinone/menaquinone biosynthesis C-methylase UbiE